MLVRYVIVPCRVSFPDLLPPKSTASSLRQGAKFRAFRAQDLQFVDHRALADHGAQLGGAEIKQLKRDSGETQRKTNLVSVVCMEYVFSLYMIMIYYVSGWVFTNLKRWSCWFHLLITRWRHLNTSPQCISAQKATIFCEYLAAMRLASGQIIIFHQAGFPWNKGISLTKSPFGVRSCEVAIIWPACISTSCAKSMMPMLSLLVETPVKT